MNKEDLIGTIRQMLDSMDEETFAELAHEAINEVMHKLEELQEIMQKNRPVLTLVDFACVIGMSVMGPANIADPDERTDEFPGHMLTRTVVGDKTSCKAAVTVLANQIRHLDNNKEDRNE